MVALLTAVSLAFTYAEELKKFTFEQAYLDKVEKLLKPLPQIFGWLENMSISSGVLTGQTISINFSFSERPCLNSLA
jgi:hypothetical protein